MLDFQDNSRRHIKKILHVYGLHTLYDFYNLSTNMALISIIYKINRLKFCLIR